MPPLTIGMPVYNGAATLDRAISSLLAQTFSDFELVVSDNASTDNSATIAEHYAQSDPRVRVVRQPENIGAASNFFALIRNAETRFFMWAAADDEWSANYLEECGKVLNDDVSVGFAGGSVVNIGSSGNILRCTPPFRGLDSRSRLARITRYAFGREADGKANLIYSVFRTSLLKGVCTNNDAMSGWGGDVGLVMSALHQAPYRQAPQATLYKRVASDGDIRTVSSLARKEYEAVQFRGNFPPRVTREYLDALTRNARFGERLAIVAALYVRRLDTLGWELRQRGRNLQRKLRDPAA